MSVLEAIVLYLVLFFPSVFVGVGEKTVIAFSISQELMRIFIYNIPSLALIWFFLLRQKSGVQGEAPPFLPAPRTVYRAIPRNAVSFFVTFILAFFGLLAVNTGVSIVSGLAESASGISFEADVTIQTPSTAAGWSVIAWFVLSLSCLSAGYLEETFFRYYLSDRLKEYGPYPAMLMSSVSFAFCHVYEGVFGVANAFFAGLLLFFIFNKRKSGNGIQALHALAFAHGTYNALMYAVVALNL